MNQKQITCWKQDGKDGNRTLEICEKNHQCYLLYKLNEKNYDNVTAKIINYDHVIALQSECKEIGHYDTCVSHDDCAHWWTSPSENPETGDYNMHCCCNSDYCNEVDKINVSKCAEDDCSLEARENENCFCPMPDIIPPDPLKNPHPKDHLFVILLCSIVVVIALALIGAMTYIVLRARYRQNQQSITPPYTTDNHVPENNHVSNPNSLPNQPPHQISNRDEQINEATPLMAESSIESYEEKFKDYRYCFNGPNQQSLCGEGRYGAVHRVEHRKTGQTFAMKIFRHKGPASHDNMTSIRLMWHKEYEHLKLCNHRNIVQRSGAGRFKYGSALDYAILLEYCPLGSLSSWLTNIAKDNTKELDLSDALHIARDIACGLEFLHEAINNLNSVRVPVAHRDIKSSNILLRSPKHAIISDFGLAIALNNHIEGSIQSSNSNQNTQPDIDVHRLKQCGTPRYLAPELLEGPMDVHNFADAFRQADVYSMSIVHWELFRMSPQMDPKTNGLHELPYQAELEGQKATIDRLQSIVSKGTRPIVPIAFRDTFYGATIYKILIESWDHDPSARVTASTVNQRLQGMIEVKSITKDTYNQQQNPSLNSSIL